MKLYKWILTAGLVLIALGLIMYSIVNVWTWKIIAPLVLGFGASVFALIKLDIRSIFKNRRVIYGGNMALVIILVIAIIGLVDFFFARHTWRADTTASGTFSLSDQTRRILKNLDKDINVIAFAKKINKGSIEDRLNEYRHYSKRIKWEIVDPDEKPALARQYKVKNYGNLVILCNGKEEQIPNFSEESITNAIIKVTREGQKRVAFLTGHGESSITSAERDGYEKAKQAIEAQNYTVEELLIADKDSIPAGFSVVVVAGPKKILFAKELDMLTKYIEKGGSVLFMLDPRPSAGLIDYMKNWHFDVGDNLVIDASGFGRIFGAGPDIPLVSNYTTHPIVQNMKGTMTFFPMAHSVRALAAEDNGNESVEELTQTSPQSFAVNNIEDVYRTGRVSMGPNDLRGPLSVACAVTLNATTGQRKARIVTVGDSDFASNAYFGNQSNGDFFMNIVSWLLADEDLISIRAKDPEIRMVDMTPGQTKTVMWLTVIILPAIAFGVAIMVYVRRK
ncbi:MAG: GldG family protein [Candidatus Neomarinimicrobiota bacterium]